MKELKVFKGPGCQSNAAKVEALMRHLAYSEEKIAEVLKTMKKKKAKDEERDDLDDLIGKHCEAETLSRLLHEKPAEEEEGQGKGKKRKYAEGEGKEKKDDEKKNKDGEKPVAWPKHVDKSSGHSKNGNSTWMQLAACHSCKCKSWLERSSS